MIIELSVGLTLNTCARVNFSFESAMVSNLISEFPCRVVIIVSTGRNNRRNSHNFH